jgi:hypothetical protein
MDRQKVSVALQIIAVEIETALAGLILSAFPDLAVCHRWQLEGRSRRHLLIFWQIMLITGVALSLLWICEWSGAKLRRRHSLILA